MSSYKYRDCVLVLGESSGNRLRLLAGQELILRLDGLLFLQHPWFNATNPLTVHPVVNAAGICVAEDHVKPDEAR